MTSPNDRDFSMIMFEKNHNGSVFGFDEILKTIIRRNSITDEQYDFFFDYVKNVFMKLFEKNCDDSLEKFNSNTTTLKIKVTCQSITIIDTITGFIFTMTMETNITINSFEFSEYISENIIKINVCMLEITLNGLRKTLHYDGNIESEIPLDRLLESYVPFIWDSLRKLFQ